MNEELKIIISAEIDKFKKNIDSAKNTVKDFVSKNKEKIQEFNDEFQKVGDASKNALGVMAGALAGAGTALMALGENTKEYRQAQAQLKTAFETAGGSAEDAKATYNDLFRVLGDSGKATEAATHLAKLTDNEKELGEYTNILQGVYATFTDSLPVEGLSEALNHTAKLGEVQGSLADALEWSGVSVDAFNAQLAACNSESEREELIRTTLNGLYGEAAAGYEKNNSAILAQNEAQAKMTEAMAKLGEVTTPIMTMLTELGAEILADLTPYIQEFGEKHLPDIKDALTGVGEAIGKVITWIADNWELVSTIAIVVASITAALSILSTVMGIVNAVMLASPITWIILAIVAAVAALVAIIVVCVKHWDDIKAAAKKAWEGIKSAWSAAGEWFSGIWAKISGAFKSVGTFFKEKFSQAWQSVKNVFSSVGDFFSNVWNKIKNIFSKVGSTIASAITNTVKKAINSVLSTAVKIINGFISAINFAIGIINKIPSVNIGRLDKLSVPQMAKGGIVDTATLAVIGERGKEAVLPLENNTEWMDKLAARLGASNSNLPPLIFQVDGKTFAQISIDSINQLTKQTGTLPLVMA